MEKLMDILLQKPIAFATKEIIRKAKSCEDDREFDKAVLQFFVDFLAKDYDITDDDLEEIGESRDGFHQMIMEIYESDDVERVSTEIPYHTFIDSLISELFIVDKLNFQSLTNFVDFFTLIIEEGTIPEEATFKAKSHAMLSFMLPPLAKLVKLSENPDSNVIDDLKLAINESIEKIMKNIEIGFKYEQFGIECVKHLTAAIKIHPNLFIPTADSLKFFSALLSLDDRTLLALALTSLTDLCHIQSLHDNLKDFFFPEELQEGEEVLIDQIFNLLHHRNLKLEVLQLFSALTTIESDFLSEKQRAEIFMNIFAKNKKIVTEVSSMMATMNVDYWLEIIKMINFQMDASEIDVDQIIQTLEGASPKKFLKITCEHIEDEVTAERAAEMFVATLKVQENPTQHLSSFKNALKTCAGSSRVVSILLRVFEAIKTDEIINFYKEHPEEIPVDVLAAIFDSTNSRMLEKVIVNVLFIFHKFTPHLTLQEVLKLKNGYVEVFKEVSINGQDPSQNYLDAIKKLSALFECRYWQIMDDHDFESLYDFAHATVIAENRYFYIHPYFLRLYVNIVKHLWVKVVKKKKLPLNQEELEEKTREFKKVLEVCYQDDKYSYEGRCLALASLLELLVMFQPSMADRFNFFDSLNFPVSKVEVFTMSEMAEVLVFDSKQGIENDYFKFQVIHAYEAFYINFIKLPSQTSWELFLAHYRHKVPFKIEIEHLMEHALKVKSGVFDKTVAFTILNMSLNYGVEEFRNFYNALEVFLKRHQPDAKDRGIRLATICSYSIEKLAKHLIDHKSADNRLLPLDFLTIVIKNLEPIYKRNLSEFVKLKDVKLTSLEMKSVENFKKMLLE